MKYKKLTKEQIIISLDRITRFKNTKEKYLRVFSDIISAGLIEPKLKKSEIYSSGFDKTAEIAAEILNFSLGSGENFDTRINERLKEYENSVFINDSAVQKLLDNKINYTKAIELIPDNAPVNLKWLKSFAENGNPETLRRTHLLKYPLREVILAEGITEEILLPAFAKYTGFDFCAEGVQVIPSGGKNQVVKMYYKISSELRLPVFILLDKDAEENIRQIQPKLRNIDRIHLVACGEFEDLLPKSLIVKTINSRFSNFFSVSEQDFPPNTPSAKTLDVIFKSNSSRGFKKAEFAKLVRDNISEDSDVSDEIKEIINEISNPPVLRTSHAVL